MITQEKIKVGKPLKTKAKTKSEPLVSEYNRIAIPILPKTENKKKHGGVRPNSGRKRLPTFTVREIFQKAFDKMFTQKDWEMFIENCKQDPRMLAYIIDQRMGRAPQTIELGNKEGETFKVKTHKAKSLRELFDDTVPLVQGIYPKDNETPDGDNPDGVENS